MDITVITIITSSTTPSRHRMAILMFLWLPKFPFPIILVLHLTRVRTPGPYRADSTLLDKLVSQVIMKLAVFHTVWSFITELNTDRQWTYPKPAESCPQSHNVHFNITVRCTSPSPKLFFLRDFLLKFLTYLSFPICMLQATPNLSSLICFNTIWWR